MRAFEDRFLTIGLPYRVIGGPRFYERLEIRDAMAYFRLAVTPTDDLAFERIVNTPKRGLGTRRSRPSSAGRARRRRAACCRARRSRCATGLMRPGGGSAAGLHARTNMRALA
jgi:DNA helicase II / ATP-dependent DNA helicase PcrA